MESPVYARHAFAVEMQQLEHVVLEMGSHAESMVREAVVALHDLKVELAMEVILRDDEVDRRDLEVESRCLKLLALQQPTGSDLRAIGTMMKIITDIERVGDLAVDLAKIAMKVEKEMGSTRIIDIPSIGYPAAAMFHEALDAFVRRDAERVQGILSQDDAVDERYRELRAEIFENMRINPDGVVTDGWLFLAIHHIERIADHAVNIAERVNFMVTGEVRKYGGQQNGASS
ncbi:MAG: phosphate signaling complex protein PhoU [Fimbriimonas sp.]